MSFSSSQTLRTGVVVFKRKHDPTSGRKVRFLNNLIALSGNHSDPLVADEGLDSGGEVHSGLAGSCSWGLLQKHLLGINDNTYFFKAKM